MTIKQAGEERVYSAYTSIFAVHHQRKSGQELKQGRIMEAGAWRQEHGGRSMEAGADAEATETICLLACFTWLMLSHRTQVYQVPPTIQKIPYSWILWRYFFN